MAKSFFEVEQVPRKTILKVEVLELYLRDNVFHEKSIKFLVGSDLERFLDLLALAKNNPSFKVSTPIELDFILENGGKKRFRADKYLVRPSVPGSAVGNTWEVSESLATFFQP
jgi:hypothetical protein